MLDDTIGFAANMSGVINAVVVRATV